MNTRLSGASPDDFESSTLVLSLDARPLAPLQAVRLPLCSTFQKLLRTTGPTAGFLGLALPSIRLETVSWSPNWKWKKSKMTQVSWKPG